MSEGINMKIGSEAFDTFPPLILDIYFSSQTSSF